MRTCGWCLELSVFFLVSFVFYLVSLFFFRPFLMSNSALNERSRSNPLCYSSLGSVVTSDYVTPLTPFAALSLSASLCKAPVWQAFPGHTEYLAAEWLDRKENGKNWTTVPWTNEQGSGRTCDKKRKYLEALWLLLADDDVLWGYRYRHRTKAGFSYAMTRGWYETGER